MAANGAELWLAAGGLKGQLLTTKRPEPPGHARTLGLSQRLDWTVSGSRCQAQAILYLHKFEVSLCHLALGWPLEPSNLPSCYAPARLQREALCHSPWRWRRADSSMRRLLGDSSSSVLWPYLLLSYELGDLIICA